VSTWTWGWLGAKGTDFEPWLRLAPLDAEKSWPLLRTMVEVLEVEVAREKSRAAAI
jgi:hypothetical protein